MRYYSLFTVFCLCSFYCFSQDPRVAPFAYPSTFQTNYVRTWASKAPQTDASKLQPTASVDSFTVTTQYLDALGRSIQTVVKGNSTSGNDLVSVVEYDNLGRQQHAYPTFTANGTGGNTSLSDGQFKFNPFQQDSTFCKGMFSDENFIYSQVFFEASPLNRQKETFAPGNSWSGTSWQTNAAQRRSVRQTYQINTVSDSVRIWIKGSTAQTAPTTDYFYQAGELTKNIIADEHDNQVIEYKDKEGKTILKKVQLSANPGTGHIGWLCTYYVYDDLGNLVFVLQPEATLQLLVAGNWVINNTVRDELCFYYGYDARNRLNIKKVPGAGEVHMVYDKRDRLVMVQDGNMRGQNKWMVTLYDELNRPVQTGLWNNTNDRSYHSTAASNVSGYAYPFSDTNVPSSGWEMLTRTHYDDYSNIPIGLSATLQTTYYNGIFLSTYNAAPNYAQALTQSNATKGMVTWTEVKVLGTSSQYLASVNIYDDKGRIIQVQSKNVTGGIDIASNQYDFSGKVLFTQLHHQMVGGSNAQSYDIATQFLYDNLGRTIEIKKKINAEGWKSISRMEYDELGQLKNKKFGIDPANSANGLENLSYDYNIRGWMLGANRSYAKSTNSTSNYFGFDLGYDKQTIENLGTYASAQYNGNIAGMLWKSTGDDEVRKFDFSYDAVNRLTAADFNQYTSGFNKTAGIDFSVSNLSYDYNGNILSQDQKGWKLGGSSFIDRMSYYYNPQSNKLDRVTDQSNDLNSKLGDFKYDDLTKGTQDYSYDVNGNLIIDQNKKISAITYNHLNLPSQISVTGKGTISYTYDAAGNKLKKTTLDNTVSPAKTTTTLYLTGIYENELLQFIPHEEGRIRVKPAEGSNPAAYHYDYFLKDHLGNVRMVLTEENKSDMYPAATMEEENKQTEVALYARIEETRTPLDDVPDYPSDTYTDPNDYVSKTIAEFEMIGPNITLKVMAGDKINLRVSSWYKTYGASPENNLDAILSDILNSMAGGVAGLAPQHGTDVNISQDNGFQNSVSNFIQTQNQVGNTKPRAFLNWVLLDEQFKFVSSSSGFDQVGNDDVLKTHQFNGITMAKNGYLFVYVSNESQSVPVYFDNLQVTHIRGSILEETHYYPFGLTMAGISSKAAHTLDNKYEFGGKEKHENEFSDGGGLETYDFTARMYDPQIGRMWQVDPWVYKYERQSPYVGFNDNPVIFADPTGKGGILSVKEREDGTIYLEVKSTLYVYSYDKNIDVKCYASKILSDINSQFNNTVGKNMGRIAIEDVDVEFNVSVEVISSEKAEKMVASNTDLSVNFVGLFDREGEMSRTIGNTSNLNVRELDANGTTNAAHEYAHLLGYKNARTEGFKGAMARKYGDGNHANLDIDEEAYYLMSQRSDIDQSKRKLDPKELSRLGGGGSKLYAPSHNYNIESGNPIAIVDPSKPLSNTVLK